MRNYPGHKGKKKKENGDAILGLHSFGSLWSFLGCIIWWWKIYVDFH